jgi:hypothetical protein
MKGGGECTACNMQNGGKMSGLNPESLSGDSFDSSGGSLAKQAYNLYVKQGHDLASLKGGRARSKGKSAKNIHANPDLNPDPSPDLNPDPSPDLNPDLNLSIKYYIYIGQ